MMMIMNIIRYNLNEIETFEKKINITEVLPQIIQEYNSRDFERARSLSYEIQKELEIANDSLLSIYIMRNREEYLKFYVITIAIWLRTQRLGHFKWYKNYNGTGSDLFPNLKSIYRTELFMTLLNEHIDHICLEYAERVQSDTNLDESFIFAIGAMFLWQEYDNRLDIIKIQSILERAQDPNLQTESAYNLRVFAIQNEYFFHTSSETEYMCKFAEILMNRKSTDDFFHNLISHTTLAIRIIQYKCNIGKPYEAMDDFWAYYELFTNHTNVFAIIIIKLVEIFGCKTAIKETLEYAHKIHTDKDVMNLTFFFGIFNAIYENRCENNTPYSHYISLDDTIDYNEDYIQTCLEVFSCVEKRLSSENDDMTYLLFFARLNEIEDRILLKRVIETFDKTLNHRLRRVTRQNPSEKVITHLLYILVCYIQLCMFLEVMSLDYSVLIPKIQVKFRIILELCRNPVTSNEVKKQIIKRIYTFQQIIPSNLMNKLDMWKHMKLFKSLLDLEMLNEINDDVAETDCLFALSTRS